MNRRRDGVQPFFELFERLRVPPAPRLGELALEFVGRGHGPIGQPFEGRLKEAGALGLVHVGEQDLAVRRAVERRVPPDPVDRDDRARSGHLIDVHDAVAREHAEVRALAGPLGQLLENRTSGSHEVQARHRGSGQPHEAEPDPVALAGGVAL